MRSSGRALWIFTTPPCDFVIALEFFPNLPIKREAWEFRFLFLETPTRVEPHWIAPCKFTALLSTAQIMGKFTIVRLYANWLIQLSSGHLIGCRASYCQLVPAYVVSQKSLDHPPSFELADVIDRRVDLPEMKSNKKIRWVAIGIDVNTSFIRGSPVFPAKCNVYLVVLAA